MQPVAEALLHRANAHYPLNVLIVVRCPYCQGVHCHTAGSCDDEVEHFIRERQALCDGAKHYTIKHVEEAWSWSFFNELSTRNVRVGTLFRLLQQRKWHEFDRMCQHNRLTAMETRRQLICKLLRECEGRQFRFHVPLEYQ